MSPSQPQARHKNAVCCDAVTAPNECALRSQKPRDLVVVCVIVLTRVSHKSSLGGFLIFVWMPASAVRRGKVVHIWFWISAISVVHVSGV